MTRIRAFLSVLTMIALIGALDPLPGSDTAAAETRSQRVRGRIQEATGYLSSECRGFEAHRIAALAAGDVTAPNQAVGFGFKVKPRTVGKSFRLRPGSVPADADLAIAFYKSLGQQNDPSRTPKRVIFSRPGHLSEELGRVPTGYPLAIVCADAGETPVTFSYRTF